ncbi:phytanoyl-CoA dioxygenase family protein [Paraglaciecola agarilytica]|jgi:phytanoyl-CoA hydroxylase|uniref:phytanoyl-CoA dioxygenase family protein n=1 Tax=Paraglaciecola chathamensis TaxID=368405 RepID=UPI001C08D51D|nr:phytanoyl-CoA dioxygenase family protein [Paraglaciecola agarilytica]MBU3019370.1 phytanoyl-CoA dioxygenase family protein [Paraglaciecola agarilytica]
MSNSLALRFREDGFVILRGVHSRAKLSSTAIQLDREIHRLRNEYQQEKADSMAKWCLPHRLDNGVLYDVYQRYPLLRALIDSKRVIRSIEFIMPEGFFLYVSSYLFKPPYADNVVPWHQDFLSRNTESEKVIVWAPLEDVSEKNGCLRVIRGSHKNGFRKWFRVNGATHRDRIDISEEEARNAENIIMKAGDVLLFSNYLIHSSEQNDSNDYRRALRYVFKSTTEIIIPRCTPIIFSTGRCNET